MRCGACRKFEFGDSERAVSHSGDVLDPVVETAQEWSAFLEVGVDGHVERGWGWCVGQWLLNDPAAFVELHINPARYKEVSELPSPRGYQC